MNSIGGMFIGKMPPKTGILIETIGIYVLVSTGLLLFVFTRENSENICDCTKVCVCVSVISQIQNKNRSGLFNT